MLWNGQDVDQPCLSPLRDERVVGVWDRIVHLSAWHKAHFDVHFPWTRSLSCFVRHGSGVPFCSQVSLRKEPLLVYMSTPYRGLVTLAKAWPLVRLACPEYRLEVFSGMNLYGRGEEQFERLYGELREMEGVSYSACVGQVELAERVSRAVVLAYPATFRETFCVSLVDAMCVGVLSGFVGCGCFAGDFVGVWVVG